jgi:diguanylate cyclase (GGDEF)-like protein/PAS domain S-box-containing protein
MNSSQGSPQEQLLAELATLRKDLAEARNALERRKAEEARINRAKREWELTVDTVDDLIMILDARQRIVRLNRALANRLAASFHEVVGTRYGPWIYGSSVPPYNCPYLQFVKDGKEKRARRVRLSLGGFFDISVYPLEGEPDEGPRAIFTARDVTWEKKTEDALRQSEAKYRMIFERSPLGILHYDRQGVITACNENFVGILGSSKEKLIGLSMLKDIENRSVIRAVRESLSEGLGRYEGEYTSVTGKKTVCVKCVFTRLSDEAGGLLGGVGIVEDVTERMEAEKRRTETENRYRQVVEKARDVIYVTNEAGIMTLINPFALRLTGYSEEEVIGAHYLDMIPNEYRDDAAKFYGAQFVKRIPDTHRELAIRAKDGTVIWLDQFVHLIVEGDRPLGFQAIARDITDRKRIEREREELIKQLTAAGDTLKHKAAHDDLTGLWNRAAILDRLRIELLRSVRERRPLAAIMADLDFFKEVNDRFGHLAGDAVLKEAAGRLASGLRPYDSAGRYGGEEFLITLPGCDLARAKKICERLRRRFEETPVAIPEGVVPLTASFGIAISDGVRERDVDEMIRAADNALYKAKAAGRNRIAAEEPIE